MSTDITKEQPDSLADSVKNDRAFWEWWRMSGWKGNADPDAAIEAWQAALTQQAGVNAEGWRPIETAPKDETGVLGYQALDGGIWIIAPMYFRDGVWKIIAFHIENTEFEMQPTHWMPIPAAPSPHPRG